jgi:gas vesicle protein
MSFHSGLQRRNDMKRLLIAMAIGTMVASGAAMAAAPVNVRQLNQERRIDAGLRSGKLTRSEANRLRAQQASIRAEVKRMRVRHPHGLTESDKRRLTALQDQADRAILRQKDDAQRGPNKLKM